MTAARGDFEKACKISEHMPLFISDQGQGDFYFQLEQTLYDRAYFR